MNGLISLKCFFILLSEEIFFRSRMFQFSTFFDLNLNLFFVFDLVCKSKNKSIISICQNN